jgi:PmbA protein
MSETHDQYEQLADRALKVAGDLGAQWCDVSVGHGRDIGVTLEKTAVKEADSSRGQSASIRVFIDGAMGFATCGGLDEDRVLAAARRAAGMAREGTPDAEFHALPGPDPAPEIDGLFDPAIDTMTVDDVVAIAVANLRLARELEPDVNLSGQIGLSCGASLLVSSTGLRLWRRRTMLEGEIEALITRGDDKGFYYDFDSGRQKSDCHAETIARAAIEGARRMLGARRVASGRMSVVLGPLATYDFLSDLVSSANAESLQRGRSYLCGKLGQQIASPLLTVVDDGLVPRGLYSGAFDGEGARRRRVTVFDRGLFAAQLHNSYTAAKAGQPNTGHGSRGGSISPTNLQVALGDRTAAEIIRETGDGLYLAISQFSPNSTTGDLSASVDFGFRIQDGAIAYPVESTMISGNMLDLAAAVDAVSSDFREEPGSRMPTLRLRDIQVAGSK